MDDVAETADPPFVVHLTWRPSAALTGVDLEALSGALEGIDPDCCLQLPTPTDDVHVVSLAGTGSARSAADEALSSLSAAAAVVGLWYDVLRIEVVGDHTSWDLKDRRSVGPGPVTARRRRGCWRR